MKKPKLCVPHISDWSNKYHTYIECTDHHVVWIQHHSNEQCPNYLHLLRKYQDWKEENKKKRRIKLAKEI